MPDSDPKRVASSQSLWHFSPSKKRPEVFISFCDILDVDAKGDQSGNPALEGHGVLRTTWVIAINLSIHSDISVGEKKKKTGMRCLKIGRRRRRRRRNNSRVSK